MKTEKCCACGANVEVIGDTTKSYKNLDKEIIDDLKKELDQQRFNNKHNLSIDTKVSDKIMHLEEENSVLRDDACRMIEYQNKLEKLMKSYCYCSQLDASSRGECIYCDDMEELDKEQE